MSGIFSQSRSRKKCPGAASHNQKEVIENMEKDQEHLSEKVLVTEEDLEKWEKELEQQRNHNRILRAHLEQSEKELELVKARVKMI